MKRLLCIVSSMNAGGAETFLMKLYRSLDRARYQMDFCVSEPEKGVYEDEIVSMGGMIHRITPKSKDVDRFKKELFEVVKKADTNTSCVSPRTPWRSSISRSRSEPGRRYAPQEAPTRATAEASR